MPQRFKFSYVPGRLIPGPDAAPRKPNQNAEYDDENELDPYTGLKMGAAVLEILMIDTEHDLLEEGITAAARAIL